MEGYYSPGNRGHYIQPPRAQFPTSTATPEDLRVPGRQGAVRPRSGMGTVGSFDSVQHMAPGPWQAEQRESPGNIGADR